jgi:uncharacterized membrane protein YeaQ/YmgE (transglycosylase-associated protein family)
VCLDVKLVTIRFQKEKIMSVETLVVWVIVGAIAGWLASLVMKTNARQGLVQDIMVGVIGGIIGGFLFNALGVGGAVTGLNVTSVLVAFVGAIVLLALIRVFSGGGRRRYYR